MPLQILPRGETNLEAFSNAASSLLQTIMQVKQIRRDREVRTGLMDIIGTGGGPEQITKYLGSMQQAQSGGGILQRILSTVNPMTPAAVGTSSLEDAIMGRMMQTQMDPMMGLRKRYMESQIGATEALTAERKRPKEPKQEKLIFKDAKGKTRIWRGSAEELSQQVDEIINVGGTIDTKKSTLSDERLRLYEEAKAAGDTEAAELALYGKPAVQIAFGKEPWTGRFKTEEEKRIEAEAGYEEKTKGKKTAIAWWDKEGKQRKRLIRESEANEFTNRIIQEGGSLTKPKPLTPTEQKGVKTTIEEVIGKAKALPFGILPGAAFKQADMNKLWEAVMESTGYSAREKVQQKQIDQEFDLYIAKLNKGKGPGVLANQYQWDRKKYQATKTPEQKSPVTEPIVETEPQTVEEFEAEVERLKTADMEEARAYYDKWAGKWQ